ncbi:MAG: hypothetical protein P0Y55_04390 [Candidatus Cohnella colombiensis]|uniref:Uncharacterized protein n=1 Tax=Candidatus Cohnella colombiensis TaxID=3121368 RepID=A0AA95F1S1_9BACL|nr:MAG: hypothetical protein P0Y55_04390 [Cohnella sp.]
MRIKTNLSLVYGAIVAVVVVLLFPEFSYNDPDTFWHIELGRYMIEHQTVLHHAIHTFYNDQLPYVPHEFGFQIIIATLYMTLGWPGIYLLTAVCMYFLIVGLIRLTQISRKELGLSPIHAALLLVVLTVSIFIYYFYFTSRPQMISACLIVWFFIFLRLFRLEQKFKHSVILVGFSCLLANIHAGVWPVIAVFTVMAIIEALFEKRLTKRKIITFALIFVAGMLNVGGLKSILYITTVTHNNTNMLINEWQPIHFGSLTDMPQTILLLVFASLLPFALHKKLFRYMFMLGILFLGVSSYKQNLFMWLFLPYFAATVVDQIPYLHKIDTKLNKKFIVIPLILALLFNIGYVFIKPPVINQADYPVLEMTYILEQTEQGTRPHVLTNYGASGYVNFRGGNILTDGRQDPFITDASKGVFGWTAFQRSMHGFNENLPDIVNYDQPDYVITKLDFTGRAYDMMVSKYGKPVFTGDFGNVFHIRK